MPTGNTKWKEEFNGPANGHDAGTGLVVNGVGVVYLSALTTNTTSGFDITTIKISQTPVYYPIDFNNVNEPGSPSHYFYPNSGEILTAGTSTTVAQNVQYYTKHTNPQEFLLDDNKIAFILAKGDTTLDLSGNDTLNRVDLEFFQSNPLARMHHFDTHDTDGVLNYFLGQLASNITDVKGSGRIMIPNLYPGIDAHLYSNNKGLKIYFVVKPNVKTDVINLLFTGANTTTITGSNQLKINTQIGNFQFEAPEAYWVDPLLNTYSVSSSWNNLGSNKYGVNTGTYNIAWPLVIQINQGPASTATIQNVSWSTYFGGSLQDKINKNKTDVNNNLFVAGETVSANFPAGTGLGVFPAINGGYDGFLAKFNPTGVLLWSTYLGGSAGDQIVDFDFNANSVYCIGSTGSYSPGLPTFSKTGAFNDGTVSSFGDGFIFQTSNAGGNVNNWCTYYGGNGVDELRACKFDATGAFFVTGISTSTDIAVVATGGQYSQTYNTAQLSMPAAPLVTDGIIMKFAASNSALNWATYYGTYSVSGAGSSDSEDDLKSITTSGSDIYVCGSSLGNNLPGKINNKGTANFSDGIIVNFTTNGNLVNSKYTTNLVNNSIKVNNNKVYVCGQAKSGMVPVNSGSYYYNGSVFGSDLDGDFSVHSLNLQTTIHSTFLGGSTQDRALDIQFAQTGVFYIAGITSSVDFPTYFIANAYGSFSTGYENYFLSTFKEGYNSLVYSTYYGSGFYEDAASIAISSNNNLYLTGSSTSYSTFPVDNGGGNPTYFQAVRAGGPAGSSTDGTITRLSLTPINVIIGINEVEATPSLGIYPNPTNKYIIINNTELANKSLDFSIFNISGQKILNGNLNSNQNKIIDVSILPYGVYMINITSEGKIFTSKFIKVTD